MTIGLAVALRNARLDAIDDAVNAGSGAGKLRIYNGSRPATGGAVTTLLAELPMSDPAFGAASAGVMTAAAITSDAAADTSGTASWFRIVDSDNNFVCDGDVGTSGSDLNLNTVTVTVGQPVAVTSLVLTAGNA